MKPVTSFHVVRYRSHAELPELVLSFLDSESDEIACGGSAWMRLLIHEAMSWGLQTFIYVVFDSDNQVPVAALPIRTATPSRWRVRPHGPQALNTMFTSQTHPVVARNLPDPVPALAALFRRIADEPECDSLKLSPVTDEFRRTIGAGLRAAGLVPYHSPVFNNWFLDVAGRSADEYLSQLPSRLANTVRRKTGSLINSGQGRLVIVTRPDELEKVLTDCEQVYRRGWQSGEAFQGFDAGLKRACAAEGWLRLGLLYVNGEPAAAQFWIVQRRTALIVSLTFDARYAKSSPGTVLTAHLMRHVIDVDGVREVDFLTGNDPFKRDWMSHGRVRYAVLALNTRTVRGWAGVVRHGAGMAARRPIDWAFSRVRRLIARFR